MIIRNLLDIQRLTVLLIDFSFEIIVLYEEEFLIWDVIHGLLDR